MKFTYCGQDGKAGGCLVAQVWGPDGKSLATIEPSDDPAEATRLARLFAAAPDLLAELRETADWLDQRAADLEHVAPTASLAWRGRLQRETAYMRGRAAVIRQTILTATQGG